MKSADTSALISVLQQWNEIQLSHSFHDTVLMVKYLLLKQDYSILILNLYFILKSSQVHMKKDNWISMCKKMNLDTDLTSFTGINSKWTMDLNVKHKTIKLLEDNRGANLDGLGAAMYF